MQFLLDTQPFYAAEGMATVVLLEEQQSLQVSCWFLCVVTFGVSQPLDQVL